MNKLLIILPGLLALALLGFFCAYKSHAPSIQHDIQTRTGSALATEGLDWANASVDGRDITLTGIAPDEAARNRAEEVTKVAGYNVIDNQIQIATKPAEPAPVVVTDPYTMTAIKDDSGKVTLTGFVPNEDTRSLLTTMAVSNFGENNVIDELKIVSAAPDYWLDSVKAGLSELSLLDEGQASWNNNTLNVTGQVASAEVNTQLRENITGKLPENITASFDLMIPETVAEPVSVQMTEEQKVAAVSCQDQFADLLSRNIIVFRTNSAEIASDSHGLLDTLAEVANSCPSASIQIEGHTDSRGAASYNMNLSQRRAQSVVDYLIAGGLDSARLTAAGFGEEAPIADNNTEDGRSINRRIEFNIKGL